MPQISRWYKGEHVVHQAPPMHVEHGALLFGVQICTIPACCPSALHLTWRCTFTLPKSASISCVHLRMNKDLRASSHPFSRPSSRRTQRLSRQPSDLHVSRPGRPTTALAPPAATALTPFDPQHLTTLRTNALTHPSFVADGVTEIANLLNAHQQYRGGSEPMDPNVFMTAEGHSDGASTVIGRSAEVNVHLKDLCRNRTQQRRLITGGSDFVGPSYWHEGRTVTLPRLNFAPPSATVSSSRRAAGSGGSSSRDSFHTAESLRDKPIPLLAKGKQPLRLTQPLTASASIAIDKQPKSLHAVDRTDPRQINPNLLAKEHDHPMMTYIDAFTISSNSSSPIRGSVQELSSDGSVRSSSDPAAVGRHFRAVPQRTSGSLMRQQQVATPPQRPKPFQQGPTPQEQRPLRHFIGRGGSTASECCV